LSTLWDVAAGRVQAVLRKHAGPVAALHFSADGATLLAASGDATVKAWDTTPRPAGPLPWRRGPAQAVAFAPDGAALAIACGDRTIRICDKAARRVRVTLAGHEHRIWALAYSPDGKTLAAADGRWSAGGDAGAVRLWDPAAGTLRRALPGIASLCFAL